MSQLFLFLLGIIIGYYLSRYILEWKKYRSRRDFRPVALKPYHPPGKGEGR